MAEFSPLHILRLFMDGPKNEVHSKTKSGIHILVSALVSSYFQTRHNIRFFTVFALPGKFSSFIIYFINSPPIIASYLVFILVMLISGIPKGPCLV